MTISGGREFPGGLAAAMAVPFAGEGGESGVDFEALGGFLPAAETAQWFREWCGNEEQNGSEFLVFGADGSGGCAAVWLTRPGRPLADQPVVFLGSEGEAAVVARDLGDFLWLLADGFGPKEAAEHAAGRRRQARPHAELTLIAQEFAPGPRRPAAIVVEQAAREFPDFEDLVSAMSWTEADRALG
ncbi:SMI1/KNR4 family protein [Kitasatospora sp. NPDC096147]|uniref:SMI1/KNR4 family protein n=1 Tax=Kitasatospora sp. NPDC096147 TaxID=3364093 RepID=UPI003814ADA7